MKALSVCQPWAWLIVHGYKRVENRTWRPGKKYRGPLLIHASRSRAWLGDVMLGSSLRQLVPSLPALDEYDHGAVVGCVELVECFTIAEYRELWPRDRFASGPYCWMLDSPRAFDTPITLPGRRMLFELPDSILPVE